MRVARWGLGSGAEVKSDILAGIWRIWEVVSQLSTDVQFLPTLHIYQKGLCLVALLSGKTGLIGDIQTLWDFD